MRPKNMPAVYEWVLVPYKGEEMVLTEKQYEFYKEQVKNEDASVIFYDDCEVHPSGIASAYRREADYVKRKYPCLKCSSNGFIREVDKEGYYKICPECKGTGLKSKSV